MIRRNLPQRRAAATALAAVHALTVCAALQLATATARAEVTPERIVIPAERFRSEPTKIDDGEMEGNRRFNFQSFRSRMLGLWFKRKAFLERNLTDAAAEQTESMHQICSDMGVRTLDDIAAALVHEGQGFLQEGNFEKARRSFNDSLMFGPELPDAHFGLAAVASRGGGGALGSSLSHVLVGTRALLKDRSQVSALLGNILIVGLLALVATCLLFSVGMVVRYRTLLRHDLSELAGLRDPRGSSRDKVDILCWGVLLLPLLTWVAALWTPAYWLVLTFRYQKARERLVSASLLILMILSPPAARTAEMLFGLAADPSARLLLASASTSYDPEQIVNLERKAEAHPDDPVYRFLLAGLYAHGHYYPEAVGQYRLVLEIEPRSYRSHNNLGNVYLSTGRPELAIRHYKKALEIKPDYMQAHYNTYLARKDMLQLKEAEQSLALAQSFDSRGLAALIEQARARGTAEPATATIRRDEIFRRILGESGSRSATGAFRSNLSILAAMFLLVALLSIRARKGSRSRRCVRCGEAFCQRCKIGDQLPDFCSPCRHVVAARPGLAPAFRQESTIRFQRFRDRQLRLSRISSLLAPGMGRVLDGRTLTGVLLSILWSGSLVTLWLHPRLLQPSGLGAPRLVLVGAVFFGVLAAATWVLGNLRSLRHPGGAAELWQWH